MGVTDRRTDPIMLQLLRLGVLKKNATVAACDRQLRYTHLFNPDPKFDADAAIGLRDDELAPRAHVAELMALKEHVLSAGRPTQRRVHVRVGSGDRVYDVAAEPIHGEDGRVTGVATAAVDVTPAVEVRALLKKVADRLETRSREISESWHGELLHRLSVRPQAVFPGDDLLDGVPHVVRWLGKSITNGGDLDTEGAESLRDLAGFWRGGGYSIEESLVHVDLLSEILTDALTDAAEALGADLAPGAGVEAARRLGRGLAVLKRALVSTYRDAEGERFADFGSTLAHEIRGHLGAALTAVQLVQVLEEESPLEERQARALERAEHALEQANQIVTSVHSLSRVSGDGDGEEPWSRASLSSIVEAAIAEADDRVDADIRVADDLPDVRVPAEPVHLILHNLIDNALKYRDPDADRCWVKVHAERDPDDGHLVLHVGDNGLGIPEAEQERVFMRFRRGQSASGDGFGLGLAIVRETARRLGGRILLESRPGGGSTFSLTIPERQIRE